MPTHQFSRGDDFTFTVTFTGSITAHAIKCTAKRKANLPDLTDINQLFQKSTADGSIEKTSDTTADVTIDAADTNGFTKAERLKYDIQIVDGSGKVTTTERGDLVVDLDVTRST